MNMKNCTHPRIQEFAFFLLLTALGTWIVAGLAAPANAQLEVTFMGNNGVMLSAGGKSILIDTLHNHNNNFWTQLPSSDLLDVVAGNAPFDNVRYAMATHNHPDHYASNVVLGFLGQHPDAKFIGPPQVRSSLVPNPHPQSIDITPAFQTGSIIVSEPGIEIEVFHMEHFDQFGNDFSSVQDFTYLVTMGGVSVFHLGDIDYIDENFENFDFASRNIDAVVLPTFNTLLSEANKAIIIDQINPKHIIATHLRAGILAQEVANVRALYPDATIFTTALDSITLFPVPEPSAGMLCLTFILSVALSRRRAPTPV